MLENSLLIAAAYLLGSVATAIITCRLMGLPDPRGVGSGNPGATNVLREIGKKAAIITLLGDMLKGLVPVLVGHALGVADWALAAIGLAAFIGHLYPVYFGFKGGKGVATALGVSLGFHWGLGLAVLVTWLATAFLTRISSLSALTASLFAPLYAWLITGSAALTVAAALMAVLVFWRHRSNIRNLLDGTEARIGAKK